MSIDIPELKIAQRLRVPPIEWNGLREDDVVSLLAIFLDTAGYDVDPQHLADKQHEQADVIASKDDIQLNISIKLRKPRQEDIGQLHKLKRLNGVRVYVYFGHPTREFRLAMKDFSEILFISRSEFEKFLYSLNPPLYVDVLTRRHTLYNSILAKIFTRMVEIHAQNDVTEKEASPDTASIASSPHDLFTNLVMPLWRLKDDSVALNKSFTKLQLLFEKLSLRDPYSRTTLSAIWAWRAVLDDSLIYASHVQRLLDRLWINNRSLLTRVASETRYSSHWLMLRKYNPLYKITIDNNSLSIPNTESVAHILAMLSTEIHSIFYAVEAFIDDLFATAIGVDKLYLVDPNDDEVDDVDMRSKAVWFTSTPYEDS